MDGVSKQTAIESAEVGNRLAVEIAQLTGVAGFQVTPISPIDPQPGNASRLNTLLEQFPTGGDTRLIVADFQDLGPTDVRPQLARINRNAPPEKSWVLCLGLHQPQTAARAIGAAQTRQLNSSENTFLFLRDLARVAKDLEPVLIGDEFANQQAKVIYRNREKILLVWQQMIVKTVTEADSPQVEFLENERRIATRIQIQLANQLPLLLGSISIGNRPALLYEWIPARNASETYIRSRDIDWIVAELKTTIARLHEFDIVHNDLRLPNLILDRSVRQIRLLDFEYSGPETKPDENPDHYRPFQPASSAAAEIMAEITPRMNRDNRGDLPLGRKQTDLAAVHSLEKGLRDRWFHFKWFAFRRLQKFYRITTKRIRI